MPRRLELSRLLAMTACLQIVIARSVGTWQSPHFSKKNDIYMPNEKTYFIYLLTNNYNNVLYAGVTNDLNRRLTEHKNKLIKGFTKKYNVSKLVYFEESTSIDEASNREKQIKKWNRKRKNELVETINKEWVDLYREKLIHEIATSSRIIETPRNDIALQI